MPPIECSYADSNRLKQAAMSPKTDPLTFVRYKSWRVADQTTASSQRAPCLHQFGCDWGGQSSCGWQTCHESVWSSCHYSINQLSRVLCDCSPARCAYPPVRAIELASQWSMACLPDFCQRPGMWYWQALAVLTRCWCQFVEWFMNV